MRKNLYFLQLYLTGILHLPMSRKIYLIMPVESVTTPKRIHLVYQNLAKNAKEKN